jgi:quercetin dioxygenase-like cupin family protein
VSAKNPASTISVNWSDLPKEQPRPGVTRCAVGTDDVMVVRNECEPGMELRPHAHDFPQLALFVQGTGIFHVGAERHDVGVGSVIVVPAGVEHYLEPTGHEPVVNIDVFAPARSDYQHLVEWMASAGGRGLGVGTR